MLVPASCASDDLWNEVGLSSLLFFAALGAIEVAQQWASNGQLLSDRTSAFGIDY